MEWNWIMAVIGFQRTILKSKALVCPNGWRFHDYISGFQEGEHGWKKKIKVIHKEKKCISFHVLIWKQTNKQTKKDSFTGTEYIGINVNILQCTKNYFATFLNPHRKICLLILEISNWKSNPPFLKIYWFQRGRER